MSTSKQKPRIVSLCRPYKVKNLSLSLLHFCLEGTFRKEKLRNSKFWVELDIDPEERPEHQGTIVFVTSEVRMAGLTSEPETRGMSRHCMVILGQGSICERVPGRGIPDSTFIHWMNPAVLHFNLDRPSDGLGEITFQPATEFRIDIRPQLPAIQHFTKAVFLVLSENERAMGKRNWRIEEIDKLRSKMKEMWDIDIGSEACNKIFTALVKNIMKPYGDLAFTAAITIAEFEKAFGVELPRPSKDTG